MSKGKLKRGRVAAIAAIMLCAAAAVFLLFNPTVSEWLFKNGTRAPELSEDKVTISALDVGQSNCAVIRAGGSIVMIDAGNKEASPQIMAFLKQNNIKQIDYLVLTHPHADHIGAASDIIRSVTVKEILYLPVSVELIPTNYVYSELIKTIADMKIKFTPVSKDDCFELDRGSLQVLFADGSLDELNNCSIVLKYTYGSSSALFMGDAEKAVESRLADTRNDLKSDILFAGHHGSASSTYHFFVKEVKPKFALISCGADNSYGYPSNIVMSNLKSVSCVILETDIDGTVHFVLDKSSVSYKKTA